MDSNIRERIIQKLINENIINTTLETFIEEEEIESNVDNYSDNEIGVTASGVKYVKPLVSQYLYEKDLPFTEDNIELAAKMFTATDQKIVKKNVKNVLHNEFENISDEDLVEFLSFSVFEQITNLKKSLVDNSLMEYAVETIYDNRTGATDKSLLTDVLNRYAERGWKVKTIFTNELGVNSRSVSTSLGTFGTNSTQDQVIIIFERSKLIKEYIESK